MSETKHQCGGCGGCGAKQEPQADPKLGAHPLSQIKTVIGITGGKGGTGKSLVTGLLAAELTKKGLQVGIFDADILAPAIPQMFDLPQGVTRGEAGLYPALSAGGVKVMSIRLLLEDEAECVTWHSAAMAGIVQQLWDNVIWDSLDCLLIDLPPGTGDVSLVAFERLPIDGLVIVSAPQVLVNQAAERTVRLAAEKTVPILGCVENFHGLFGGDAADALAGRYGFPVTDRLAFDPMLTDAADEGGLEALGSVYLPETVAAIAGL
ncbi:MAG: Mrp/NBP35 family ATP-binding protein [Oscillospiraceae bacterium]|nr:Mrp/NBP35 family ATP-binding protein [Oscillospiraceae bacterium]